MELPLSSALSATLSVLPETGSTNDELVERAASGGEPEFAVVLTTSQTSGRGRLGRVWVAPPGKTLAVSVLLRPRLGGDVGLGLEHFGWLPLLTGIAMTRAVASLVSGHRVSLKWPNDVLIDGEKVAGILAELLPSGDAVVMGVGVNLSFERSELPTPTSTSLLLAGATLSGDELVDAVVSRYLDELKTLYRAFLAGGADPDAARLQLRELCSTLGQQVKVLLPGDEVLFGVAKDVDETGRLVIERESDGALQAVAAGDVTHLRYE